MRSVQEIYKGAVGPHYAIVQEAQAQRVRNLNIEPLTVANFQGSLIALMTDLEAAAIPKTSASISGELSNTPAVIPDYGPHRPVFYVPFKQKGDEIVGQQQVIEDVRKQLTAGKRTAIGQTAAFRGLGGLGKTQLAIEYAYRYRDEYPNGVIWLNADQNLDAQLIEIAEKAHWIAPESEHKYKIPIAKKRIRSYSDCLIIFDNLEELEVIEPYLPEPEASPHILVTSRKDHAHFYPVPLALLDETLSRELLIREARKEPENEVEEQAARSIVVILGGLPLALELAGAYLAHLRTITFQQYYELLSQDLKSALPKRVSSFTKHEADLYSTLRLSEDLLREESRLREILDLLTWSGSASMNAALISHLLDVQNDLSLAGPLALGAELRLLQRSKEGDSYSLHRLVGEVRRTEIPLNQRFEWIDAVCRRLGDWFQEKSKDFSQLAKFESQIDHLKKWQENAAAPHVPLHSSRLMWLQAYPPYHRAQYEEARNQVIRAHKIFEELGDTKRDLKAHLLNDLVITSVELNDLRSVGVDPFEALTIRRELFGDPHPEIATSLNTVASWYAGQKDSKTALIFALQALEMRRELFGAQHPEIANSLANVGGLYGDLGDLEPALEYSQQGLLMMLDLFGEHHPSVARSLNNVGMLFLDKGDWSRGLEYLQRSLTIKRELLGERHPVTVEAVIRVTVLLMRLDRPHEAYELVSYYLTKVSPQDPARDKLQRLENQLLSKTIRPGFRQPTKRNRKAKKKRR